MVEQDNVARVRSLLHIMRGEEDRVRFLLLAAGPPDLPHSRLRVCGSEARRRLIQNKQARTVQQGRAQCRCGGAGRPRADGTAQQLAQLQKLRQLRKAAGKTPRPGCRKARRAAAQVVLHGQRLIQHRGSETTRRGSGAELLRRFRPGLHRRTRTLPPSRGSWPQRMWMVVDFPRRSFTEEGEQLALAHAEASGSSTAVSIAEAL